jgi:Domain of unknown function DUF11
VGVLRRHTHVFAALLVVLGLVLLAPGRGAPARATAADLVTMTMSAPANVVLGNHYDYTVSFTYTGDLPGGPTAAYTVTDALPAQVRFLGAGMSPQGLCPTLPPSGQNGNVSCTFEFSPNARTITLTITVEAIATGTVANTAQLSTGATASATTSVGAAPAGSITATLTGPDTIKLSATVAPARVTYTLVLAYTGPPIRGAVFASFVERLPDGMSSPGIADGAQGIRDQCQGDTPAKRFGGTLTCNILFDEEHRTNRIGLTARPTAVSGEATNVVEVSTGGTASWTTTIVPPPADAAPAPVAGPAAAPTATVAESFATTGSAEPETVKVSPTTETVQVALTWSDAASSFDVTGVTLTTGSRTLAIADKLRVTKKRSAKWLDVRIKGVHAGKLKFKIVAKKLHRRTRVVAKIRQSKR